MTPTSAVCTARLDTPPAPLFNSRARMVPGTPYVYAYLRTYVATAMHRTSHQCDVIAHAPALPAAASGLSRLVDEAGRAAPRRAGGYGTVLAYRSSISAAGSRPHRRRELRSAVRVADRALGYLAWVLVRYGGAWVLNWILTFRRTLSSHKKKTFRRAQLASRLRPGRRPFFI